MGCVHSLLGSRVCTYICMCVCSWDQDFTSDCEFGEVSGSTGMPLTLDFLKRGWDKFEPALSQEISQALSQDPPPSRITFRHHWGTRNEKHTDYTVNLAKHQTWHENGTRRMIIGWCDGYMVFRVVRVEALEPTPTLEPLPPQGAPGSEEDGERLQTPHHFEGLQQRTVTADPSPLRRTENADRPSADLRQRYPHSRRNTPPPEDMQSGHERPMASNAERSRAGCQAGRVEPLEPGQRRQTYHHFEGRQQRTVTADPYVTTSKDGEVISGSPRKTSASETKHVTAG